MLGKLLDEVLILLDSVADKFWASRIRTALRSLDPREVLSWYGGMGSFNDLVIAAVNGHQVRRDQEAAVNAQLAQLRSKIYDVATQLKA